MNHSKFRRCLAAALALLLLTGLFGAAVAEADESTFNLLLIGVDAYNPDDAGRSDSVILAQVTPTTGDIKLVSFLRDLYVKIPGHGKTRLNAAYFYGGADLLKQTLENNFSVRIDRTLAVNFSLMADLVDQVGGVDVEVTDAERRQLNAILKFYNKKNGMGETDGLLMESGMQHLTGKQALSFSRIRKIDSDFQRTSRQHLVLLGVVKQLTQMDFVSLAKLAATNMTRVKTDIQLEDVNALLPLLMNAGNLRMRSTHVPFEGAYSDETINGMMVLVPNLDRNKKQIRDFLAAE